MSIAGPAAAALDSLSPSQIYFLQSLPKAELHAHLNGSIPISVLQELASEYDSTDSPSAYNENVKAGISKLLDGPALEKISDFFSLFSVIYALTSTPDSLRRATRAVLSTFLDGDMPQCTYLELRTTPRQTEGMDRNQYLRIVLEELERYDQSRVGLIISLDRRMGDEVLSECVRLACELKAEGKRVVGMDLCGDPTVGDIDKFAPHFAQVKKIGIGITLHIAETTQNKAEETYKLLSFNPERLGHATFLDEEATSIVLEKKMCIEVCLTSNLLCKTVPTLESHHIHQYLKSGHPFAICTDDILPFRTSLLGEYALLLAQPPLGLGLSEEMVRNIGEMSLQARFK
ncbi:Metallo-dependent hydrolase [Phlegmacium glaucopus]|nr:Metallo-dependent hydrolase [Phlegmacium glaucopus]